MTPHECMKKWAEKHGIAFVGRSCGMCSTGTISADALADLAEMASAELRRERDELRADNAESEALREQLADLLHRTAIAVRGPEPELTRWSWHDVPDRVAAAIAALGGAVQTAAEAMLERDALAARLAEIERAEPVAWIERITGQPAPAVEDDPVLPVPPRRRELQ